MVAKIAAPKAPYSLYLSKYANVPAMTVRYRWILTIVEKLLLQRCDYYVIKDRNGELICEQQIGPGPAPLS